MKICLKKTIEEKDKSGGESMDKLFEYLKTKLEEMQGTRSKTVEIDCIEFMQILKLICYMKQIRRIVEDEI